jgi:hypothetical protein
LFLLFLYSLFSSSILVIFYYVYFCALAILSHIVDDAIATESFGYQMQRYNFPALAAKALATHVSLLSNPNESAKRKALDLERPFLANYPKCYSHLDFIDRVYDLLGNLPSFFDCQDKAKLKGRGYYRQMKQTNLVDMALTLLLPEFKQLDIVQAVLQFLDSGYANNPYFLWCARNDEKRFTLEQYDVLVSVISRYLNPDFAEVLARLGNVIIDNDYLFSLALELVWTAGAGDNLIEQIVTNNSSLFVSLVESPNREKVEKNLKVEFYGELFATVSKLKTQKL